MFLDGDKYLSIYLNDHLAGATAGLELARRMRGATEDTELGTTLSRLAAEIEEDRETLRAIMDELDIGIDSIKIAFGWTSEKVGRLKLNGHILSESPLSRVVELEGLTIGVDGKARLWKMLRALADPRLAAFDLDELLVRAERQRDELESHRVAAGVTTFQHST